MKRLAIVLLIACIATGCLTVQRWKGNRDIERELLLVLRPITPIRRGDEWQFPVKGFLFNKGQKVVCIQFFPPPGVTWEARIGDEPVWPGGHGSFGISPKKLQTIHPSTDEEFVQNGLSMVKSIQVSDSNLPAGGVEMEDTLACPVKVSLDDLREAEWDMTFYFGAYRHDQLTAVKVKGVVPGKDFLGVPGPDLENAD